jgi:hypothetical protein
VRYDLWDQDTANLVGSYGGKRAALCDVADAVHRYGRSSPEAQSLALTIRGVGAVAAGEELIELALAAVQRSAPDAPPRRRRAA